MASYCTRADIEARIGADTLGRIADVDQFGAENLDTVAAAITAIDGLISSKIAKAWPDSVGVATAALTAIAVDLVVDYLAIGPASTADFQRRAKLARDDLAAIASGDAMPGLVAAEPAGGSAGEVVWVAGRREFGGGGY